MMLQLDTVILPSCGKKGFVKMKKYSIINPDPTLKNNLMAFGFECNRGWLPLIYELLDKLQAIEDRDKIGLEITQIKEKYGELRVYTNVGTDEIWDLIDEYTARSITVCEMCGKPGKFRNNHGWFSALCDIYQEKIKNK